MYVGNYIYTCIYIHRVSNYSNKLEHEARYIEVHNFYSITGRSEMLHKELQSLEVLKLVSILPFLRQFHIHRRLH